MCSHTYFTSSEEISQDCPNCGSPEIEKINSSGYCADGIIPFEITKEQALKNLKSFLKSKPGIPKAMKTNLSEDKISGVYIPVWNFIFDINLSYLAIASDLRRYKNGTYYSVPIQVYGEKRFSIKSADQSATTTEFDDFLELFDEKDYDKIIPYLTEYTYGYQVDDINREIHDYYTLVTNEEKAKAKNNITNFVLNKYRDVRNLNISMVTQDEYFNFAYVPVYVYKYKHKNNISKVYVSGTTGKVAGKTPTSVKSILKTLAKFLGLFAAIALLAFLIF